MNEEERMMLEEVFEFVQAAKQQQLSFPLDDASLGVITDAGAITSSGTGSYGTQVVTDSNGDTSTVPAQPSGTIIVSVNGVTRELPYK